MNLVLVALIAFELAPTSSAGEGSITYEPGQGPGNGKHIVFICGEIEYRCEESLPMMAKILAKRHGFKCTVLFPINPKDGTVDPTIDRAFLVEGRKNPGSLSQILDMDVLKTADMMVYFMMRVRLPDEDMKHFVDFVKSGKPMFAIRTSVFAFRYEKNSTSSYAKSAQKSYRWDLLGWKFTGSCHYGRHKVESTRGLRAGLQDKSPILRGVYDVWGTSDVYTVSTLADDVTVYLYGQVLTGMNPTDPPNLKKAVMPMVWTREIKKDPKPPKRVVVSTIGCSQDMESEDLRRLYVNCIYWAMGLENKIPQKADVRYVGGDWKGTMYGVGTHKKGLRPADFAIKE